MHLSEEIRIGAFAIRIYAAISKFIDVVLLRLVKGKCNLFRDSILSCSFLFFSLFHSVSNVYFIVYNLRNLYRFFLYTFVEYTLKMFRKYNTLYNTSISMISKISILH